MEVVTAMAIIATRNNLITGVEFYINCLSIDFARQDLLYR